MWNLATNECERVLEGHTGGVSCIRVENGVLVSGSSDSTLVCLCGFCFAAGYQGRVNLFPRRIGEDSVKERVDMNLFSALCRTNRKSGIWQRASACGLWKVTPTK